VSEEGPEGGDPRPADPAPKPRRKKRRRPASAQSDTSVSARATSQAEGGEEGAEEAAPPPSAPQIPAFALGWPRDEALDSLVVAFEAGDYARVRREAPALARTTDDDAVRRAARELRRRLDPDPVAVYMLMAAAALLVFLAGWYWLHPHTP
jgi:hypothetical protein